MPPKKIKITPPSLVIKAEANRKQLVHWLQASDEDYAKYEHCSVSSKKRKSVFSVLGISAEEVETLDTKKSVMTVAGLRSLFGKYEMHTSGPFISLMLKGKGACVVCYGADSGAG